MTDVIDNEQIRATSTGPVSHTIISQIWELERGPSIGTEGAVAVTAATCFAAIAFIEEVYRRMLSIPPPRSISPSVNGEIAIYWKAPVGRLNVTISDIPSGLIGYQYKDTAGQYFHGEEALESVLRQLAVIFQTT